MRLKRRVLRCSFCHRNAAQVDRLIAGPRVFICDACIGVCNNILAAVPQEFAGWNAMTDEQLVSSLAATEATVTAVRDLLHTQVDILRGRGTSWAVIGRALGISRQAAWERFS
jgi:hypothetical protein